MEFNAYFSLLKQMNAIVAIWYALVLQNSVLLSIFACVQSHFVFQWKNQTKKSFFCFGCFYVNGIFDVFFLLLSYSKLNYSAFTKFARSHHTFANENKLCHVASISCISCAVWCDFLFFGSNISFYATNAGKSSNEKILIQLEYVWWAFVHFIFIFFTKSSKIYYEKLNSSFRLKKILFKKFFY